MARSKLARALKLLDDERRALKRSDFPALKRIVTRKTALVAGGPISRNADELARLRIEAQRNHRLIEATRAGIEDARQRLDALRNGPRSSTYSAAGDRIEHMAGQPGRLRKSV